ncbi:MAG TPA: DUF433 domain-containing protein [Thermodesulfobacteriota bacterium]|nr:DUF433 domain-containing protein [Thermodesulfobacteriota bacterium]
MPKANNYSLPPLCLFKTRVPVEFVVGKLAGGMTVEEVRNEYDLKREDILNALSYAAKDSYRKTLNEYKSRKPEKVIQLLRKD